MYQSTSLCYLSLFVCVFICVCLHVHAYVCTCVCSPVDSIVRGWRIENRPLKSVCQYRETSSCLLPVEDWCKIDFPCIINFYSSSATLQVALPNLKWMENHKPLFKVATHAVSLIHPQVGELISLRLLYWGAYFIRWAYLFRDGLLHWELIKL